MGISLKHMQCYSKVIKKGDKHFGTKNAFCFRVPGLWGNSNYCTTLWHLKEVNERKQPGFLIKKMILLHDDDRTQSVS
jgi:hypothetical protein